MSPQIIFLLQLVLGYVAWLLCFGVYIMPRLKAMDRVAAHRAIATLNSFRFFGLVFILPGVVGPHLPASFATFAAYGDFATGVLAMLALPAGTGRAVGRWVRDPDHLRAPADDHERRRALFPAASSASIHDHRAPA